VAGIVDSHVHDFPADPSPGIAPITGGTVPGSTHDAPELLGVDVEQATRMLVLVADDRLRGRASDDEALMAASAMSQGVPDLEPAAVDIDILPPERGQLALPHPRRHGEAVQEHAIASDIRARSEVLVESWSPSP
jgi:hypothetical protein